MRASDTSLVKSGSEILMLMCGSLPLELEYLDVERLHVEPLDVK
jgi:hypothetical protein